MADITTIRAIVESARDQSKAKGVSLTGVLKNIRNGLFESDARYGKTVISTSEAGGTITFALDPNMPPLQVMALFQKCLDWCNTFTDPDNPPSTGKRKVRMRASFARARIS